MQHGGWESVAIITKRRQLNANTRWEEGDEEFRATELDAGGETTRRHLVEKSIRPRRRSNCLHGRTSDFPRPVPNVF